MEWTPDRIRLLRETGLCLPQQKFAKDLGFDKRTIGNAERGTHPPGLTLRRALDHSLEQASEAQRTRFHAAIAAHATVNAPVTRSDSIMAPGYPAHVLNGLRGAVLGTPLTAPWEANNPVGAAAGSAAAGSEMATAVTAVAQVHRLYHMADYDAAAELLPAILTRLHNPVDTDNDLDECLAGTLTTQHAKAAAYLAAAKLATKLGDVGLASVTSDRALLAATESEHPALVGTATYQVACALLLTGELATAEQVLTVGAENIAGFATTRHLNLNCHPEEALSVWGSLLLLLAVIAARRGDPQAAQKALHDADQLAEQLGCDSNWLWTAFGPTNVAIHQLSVHSRLGDANLAMQIGETIDTDSLPAVLRGRRSRVHLELGWVAAEQADDAVAVLHLLEAERVAAQAVSRDKSAITLLRTLLARERRSATPGLRGLASRVGLLP